MERAKEFWGKEKINIMWVLLGLYASYSLNYLLKLIAQGAEIKFSFSVMIIPICVVVICLIRKFIITFVAETDTKTKRRRLKYAAIISCLFGVSMISGYQLQVYGHILHGMFEKLYVLFTGFGIGAVLLPVVYAYFKWLDRNSEAKEINKFTKKKVRNVFWISWGIIFVAWIPAFLAFYPAIMSYDCNRQFQEAIAGYTWFNSHHPLVHTFLIRMFLMLGKNIGSYEVGIAIFSILQMLILSVIFAYACSVVGRLTNRKWAVVLTVSFFAFLPFHQVLAISVTKDILFAAFLLLFCLLMFEHNQTDDRKKKVLLVLAMFLVGILAILFRNNAIYAFALFAIFYVMWSKKDRVIVLILCLAILAGGKFSGQAIQTAMEAGSGSPVEMYSVFLQQFARVGLYQDDNLDIDEYGIINKYVDAVYWNKYNPNIADAIKNNVNVTTYLEWRDDVPSMLKDWFIIGLKYPEEYIDAFLELTRGYWFMDDVSHAEVLGYGDDSYMGLLYTFNATKADFFEGVESKSFLPGLLEVYHKIVNGNAYYNWPILSLLFKPAFYCWALFMVMVSLIYVKKKRKLILCILPLTYLLTLLLGPVVVFRYVYPIIVMVPVLIAWLLSNCDWYNCDK